MSIERILLTGASGQIGTVLSSALRKIYGDDNVISTDIKRPDPQEGRFEVLDILNKQRLIELVTDQGITQIYHLAAILSANGEWNPKKTWNVNFNATIKLFDVAKEMGIKKIFYPSTIAVYGDSTPKKKTPQNTSLEPTTVYGISKLTGELWAKYYWDKYQLDIRSIRYPGIISYESLPGGGTTDYAVEIFHKAIEEGHYTCFLKEDTNLPMLYMKDAIRGTLELMESDADKIKVRTSYNLSGMSFSPEQLYKEIKKHLPGFTIDYKPDFRQAIADSWSESIDDSSAQKDWGWSPEYNLESMTTSMLENLKRIKNV